MGKNVLMSVKNVDVGDILLTPSLHNFFRRLRFELFSKSVSHPSRRCEWQMLKCLFARIMKDAMQNSANETIKLLKSM